MLDFFIILGEIPGTNIRFTFGQLIIVAGFGLLGYRLWQRPALRRKYIYWFYIGIFYIRYLYALHRRVPSGTWHRHPR